MSQQTNLNWWEGSNFSIKADPFSGEILIEEACIS